MHEFNGPFLSAAAIRRILSLHPFSESNRAYLLDEAQRRDAWEREVESLLAGPLPSVQEIAGPAARESTGADAVAFPR